MDFQTARDYRVPFGKHEGKRIGSVARTPEGICYLNWLDSARAIDRLRGLGTRFDAALSIYLSHPKVITYLAAAARITKGD